MSFGRTGAKQKPTIVAVGEAKSLGALTGSKTEGSPYFYETIEFSLRGSAKVGKPRLRLMWAPGWFHPAFGSPTSFAAAMDEWCDANPRPDGSPASTFVFEKNVSGKTSKETSFLEALAGTAENWEALQTALVADNENGGEKTAEEVHDILVSFFNEIGPQQVLITLKQEKRDGALGEYYEIDKLQPLTEKSIKAAIKSAEFVAAKIAKGGKDLPAPVEFDFDPADLGFDDIILPVPVEV